MVLEWRRETVRETGGRWLMCQEHDGERRRRRREKEEKRGERGERGTIIRIGGYTSSTCN